jgi:hypothetical protein
MEETGYFALVSSILYLLANNGIIKALIKPNKSRNA